MLSASDLLCCLYVSKYSLLCRHSTRILYNYGIEEVSKDLSRPADAVVREFFNEESRSSATYSESLTDAVKIGIFDYPWVSRVYRETMEVRFQFYYQVFLIPRSGAVHKSGLIFFIRIPKSSTSWSFLPHTWCIPCRWSHRVT